MSKSVKKAVIPCGGMGTRFLPITKAVPKEILPIIDTPVLAYIIDEAVKSGIEQVLIILGQGKEAIREYFSPAPALEKILAEHNKLELLELVRKAYSSCEILFDYQPEPKGSGAAVAIAERFTGDQPFALAWGDDIILGDQPVIGQLASAYDSLQTSILGVQEWLGDDIVKYGVAKVAEQKGRAYRCLGIVEKPRLEDVPSRLASMGRYILTPDIYPAIARCPKGAGGEIQLTDALAALCNTSGVWAYDFVGTRYDMGDKLGSVKAITDIAIARYGKDYLDFLKSRLN